MCRQGCHSHHTADIADYLPRVNYIQITAIKYVSPKKSTKAMHFQLQPGSTMEYFFQYSRCDFCKQWEDKAQHMSTLFLPVPFRINTRVHLCLICPLLSIWEGTDLLQNMACISLSLYKKIQAKASCEHHLHNPNHNDLGSGHRLWKSFDILPHSLIEIEGLFPLHLCQTDILIIYK